MPAVATAAGLPSRLGKYELLMPLAAGGMALIYIGRSTGIGSFERHVVLKMITPERAHDLTAVNMFLDEARLAASLNHQNVAQVFEVGEDGGIHYLAMEYVHGQDLRAVLAKAGSQGTRIPLELALTVVAGAAAGLHHAHERRGPDGQPLGIVHRDVSPSNLMIGYDGAVKLLDFGIAKATARSVETQSGIIKGKFAYMAPEQCRGRDVDRRSDVFSLGIILYEITTQHRCFRADSDFDTMHRIVTGDVVRPTRIVQGYPQALEAIVMKALATDAAQRYQSSGLLLEALESFAISSRMSLSTMGLGRFMRDMFGDVQEPWLNTAATKVLQPIVAKESTISSTNSKSGPVRAPEHLDGSGIPEEDARFPDSAKAEAARTLLDLPHGRAEVPTDEPSGDWNRRPYPPTDRVPTALPVAPPRAAGAQPAYPLATASTHAPSGAQSGPQAGPPAGAYPGALHPGAFSSGTHPSGSQAGAQSASHAGAVPGVLAGVPAAAGPHSSAGHSSPRVGHGPPPDFITPITSPAGVQPIVHSATGTVPPPELPLPPPPHAAPPAGQFNMAPGSGSGPAIPAVPAIVGTNQGYASAMSHSELSYPRYEPPVDTFTSDVQLTPNRRPLLIGIAIVVIGVIVMLIVSFGGSDEPVVKPASSDETPQPEPSTPEPPPQPDPRQAQQAKPDDDVIEDNMVSVIIHSDPAGAAVLVAGTKIGVTPFESKLKRGTKVAPFTVEKEGYAPYAGKIDLSGEYENRNIKLVPLEDLAGSNAGSAGDGADGSAAGSAAPDTRTDKPGAAATDKPAQEKAKPTTTRRTLPVRRIERTDRPERTDRSDKADKSDKTDKTDKQEKKEEKCQPPGPNVDPFGPPICKV